MIACLSICIIVRSFLLLSVHTFAIIQVIAGSCVSVYLQYVCTCTLAHLWGLCVRASFDWPINYDGLLMMCNGMIY